MNLTAIAALISAVCGFGLAWQIQGHNIIKLKLEQADERISIQRSARASIERATGQVTKAQNDAAARTTVARTDAGSAAASGNGLRDTSSTTVRATAADSTANSAIIAAYDNILSESIGAIREMANDADQCVIERQALIQAWPR